MDREQLYRALDRRFDEGALHSVEIEALFGNAPEAREYEAREYEAREYLARLKSIDAALRAFPLESLPKGLEDRILAKLSEPAEARIPASLVYASVALVAALAGLIGWLNPGLLEMPGVSQVLTAVDADGNWLNIQTSAVNSVWSMWDWALSAVQPLAITSNFALWLSVAVAGCGLFAFNAIAAVRLRPAGK